MIRVFVICGLFVVLLLGANCKYERYHPCLKYGPERLLYMQKVGNVLVPIYGKDCLQRANQ